MKKILIALLSVMLLLSTVGLAACVSGGKIEIQTKTPSVKYYVGYNVDMFDLFVQEGGYKYTFTVSKNGEEAVATGRQYYVDEAGEYTAICTATKNGASASKETTFVVYDSVPFMVIAKNNIVVDWNSKNSLNNIFAYSQARIITESGYDQLIDYVLVYDQADGSGRKVDLSLDNPSGDGMWDGRRAFKFSFEGDYDFHLVARSSGGEASGMLRVTALENYKHYTDMDFGLTVDELAGTANWNAVPGAVTYRVKIGTKSVETATTSLKITDYLTQEFANFDFVVIAVDAKGEVIGKDIAKQVVIAPKGFEGIVLSSGAKVDKENSEVNIIPASCGIHSVDGVSKADTHFLAYRGEYGVGYFVDFYFTGNNLPQVCLFSNDMDTNLTNSEGGKGILIMNGMYSGNTPDLLFNSLRAFGPNRMDEPYNHRNLFVLRDGYEQFSKTYLQKDENANNKYKYVVGSEETAHGTISLVLQLWSVDNKGNEELLYLVNKDTKIKTEELPAGNIVAYGAMAGPTVDTTFKFCKKPYSYSADGIKFSGAVFASNGEIWLAGKGLGSSSQPFTIIPSAQLKDGTAAGLSNSFIGLDGSYGVGTYIDTYFKGNNMPEIMFFADNINGNMSGYSAYTHDEPYTAKDSGEKGFLISNGMKGGVDANDTDDVFTVWGPNRVHIGEDAKLNGTFKAATTKALARITSSDPNFALLTQAVLASEQYANTEFKYTVGTFDLTGKLGIHVKLYEVKGSEEILLLEYIKDTIVDVSEIEAGGIVMYGTVKGDTELTKFRYEQPYESKPEFVYSDGMVAADGTISLAGRALGSSAQPFTVIPTAKLANGTGTGINNSYAAILGEYGIGTYLDIEFTGNNMPEVMFFADKINGNMSGYSDYVHAEPYFGTASGEKGVLITNGFIGGNTANDTNELFTVWGPNRIYMGDNVALSGAFNHKYPDSALANYKDTDENYGIFAQSSLAKPEYENTKFKYTIGTFEVSGKLGIHAKLVSLDGNTETVLAELVKGTTLDVTEVTAGNIVLFGTVKGVEEATTFKLSDPYEGKPPYLASGAAVSKDGTITTNSTATGNRMYDLANVNNNYYALDGKYGVGTYVDAFFTGNNMPEIMFFSDVISGNMTAYKTYTYVSGSGDWSNYTLSGNKGLLFSNGFTGGSNNNGAPDKYTIWGMDRVFSETGLSAGLRDATSGALKIYAKETAEAKVLSQLSLAETYAETSFKYTVGTYADGDKLAIEVIMANAETGEEMIHVNFTTEILVADVNAGAIIFYDSVKGAGEKTVFKISQPYTFGEEGHVHEYNTLKANAVQHWYECECGKWQEKIAHTGGTADCDTKANCEICNTEYGDYKHEFDNLKFDTEHHWYECQCGVTSEKVAHFGGTATATEKAKCEVCEQEYGEVIPQGTITTSKATENEDGSYTLEGSSMGNRMNNIWSVDHSYYAINGSYGVGTHIDIEFTGNNMPEVMFFANKINGNLTSYESMQTASPFSNNVRNDNYGLLFSNGFSNGTGEFSNGATDRFSVWGMNRIWASSGHANGFRDCFAGGKIFLFAESSNNANIIALKNTPSQKYFVNNADVNFKYTVGTYENAKGYMSIYVQVTNVDTNECVVIIDKATTYLAKDIIPGNIVLYDTVKGAANATTFKASEPYESKPLYSTNGAAINSDGSVTLAGYTSESAGASGITKINNSYVAYEGEYDVGTFVDFEFKGNNLPQVMFFADSINGNMTFNGGNGLIIMNGLDVKGSVKGANELNYFGPTRFPSNNYITLTEQSNGYEVSKNTLFSSAALSADTTGRTYIYKVGTALSDADTIIVCTELIDKATGSPVAVATADTAIAKTQVSAGSIVAFAAVKGANSTTTFKPGSPYKSAPKYYMDGASLNADGSISTTGRLLGNSSGQPFSIVPGAKTSTGTVVGFGSAYFALKGEYGVGTYVDVTFTGNNMPEVMFFADKISNNMSGYASYDGKNGAYGVASNDKGVLICNGLLGSVTGNDINEYFTVWGPNRIYFGDVVLNAAFVDNMYLQHALIKIKDTDELGGLAQSKLDATKNYKATFGTFEEGGKLGIYVKLVDVTGGSEVVVAELNQVTSLAITEVTAGSIVFYDSTTGANTVFKVGEPYTAE